MKFANLHMLNLLWGLIGLFALMAYAVLKRKKILLAFADIRMFPSIVPGFSQKRRWVKAVLIIVAMAFGVVALAGPRMGYRWEKTTEKGVDIMIALDCSKSMLARDIRPSRLERAKREIVDLLRMMRSDRAGLVAFSGKAFLQCPLTLDHEAFFIFLKALEPGFLPVGGTNLDEAIQVCRQGFEKDSDTQKAIIIITDGESTTGTAGQAAAKMAQEGIKIFTIGVGGLEGAPIPDKDGGFKKDGSGNIILSRVDEEGLEKLATVTGGSYVRSVAGDMDLDLIYTEKILGGMEKKTLHSGRKKVWENRYQWFLLPCLLLLLLEMMLPAGKKRGVLPLFFILLWLGAWTSPHTAAAKTVSGSVKEGIEQYNAQSYEKAKGHFIDAQLKDPDNHALYYNIGAAAYKNSEYEPAVENFLQASKSKKPLLRHAALFNLANSYYRLGRLEEAIKGYESLLEEFPEDTQARENLEFARKKAKEKKEQPQQEDKKESGQKKDKTNTPEQSNSRKDEQKERQEKKENQEKPSSEAGNDNGSSQKPDQGPEQNQDSQNNGKQEQKEDRSDHKQDGGEDRDEDVDSAESPKQQGGEQEKQPGDRSGKEGGMSGSDQDVRNEDGSNSSGSQAKEQVENMLNRLEDKPGSAMMPATGGRHVEKDW